MDRVNRFSLILVLCILILPMSSCTPNEKGEQQIWRTDSGIFYTTDMERALAKTGFPLILPSYLPEELKNAPPYVLGPTRRASTKWIEVGFGIPSSDGIIRKMELWESEEEVDFSAHLDRLGFPYDSYEYLWISGQQVIIRRRDDVNNFGTFLYFFHDGISIRVTIVGFSEEEAIRVVESILK